MANGLSSRGTTVPSLLRRFGKIAMIATYRSARVVSHTAASKIRPQSIDQAGSFPREFRLALEDLGPTFVKFGQLLSTRSDLAPAQVQRELSKLQDHAPSIPHAELLAELERSLKSDSSDLFASIEMAPVACGSIAQVHRATLHNGLRVAVKVRRPGVLADVDADLWLLRKMARVVAWLSPRVRAYDPVAILDEFAALLRAETDFVTEASNVEAVRRTFAVTDAVTIPRVLTEMSGDSVLVMDWIEGVPLTDRERLEEVGADRALLARAILQAYGVMIFQSDRFHADPHPGNLIAMKDNRLGLIDFGEVGSVEPAERSALLGMVTAVLGRDGEALAAAVLSVSRTTRSVDQAGFGGQLAPILDSVADASLKDVRLGETFGRLLRLLRHNGIVLPSDLAVLIKTLIECESTTLGLDPTMSMLSLVGELGSIAPASGEVSVRPPSARRQRGRDRGQRLDDD
jgi:ubiquinone biosynthesis protein